MIVFDNGMYQCIQLCSIYRYELKMAVTDSIFTIYSQSTSHRETFNRSMMRVPAQKLINSVHACDVGIRGAM